MTARILYSKHKTRNPFFLVGPFLDLGEAEMFSDKNGLEYSGTVWFIEGEFSVKRVSPSEFEDMNAKEDEEVSDGG